MSKVKFIYAAALLIGMASAFAGDKPVIIDVRSDQEFNQGHFDGALHMPYEQIDSMIGDRVQDKDTPIVVYCKSGRRAGIAADTLAELGYSDVENAGGLDDMLRQTAEAGSSGKCVGEC